MACFLLSVTKWKDGLAGEPVGETLPEEVY